MRIVSGGVGPVPAAAVPFSIGASYLIGAQHHAFIDSGLREIVSVAAYGGPLT